MAYFIVMLASSVYIKQAMEVKYGIVTTSCLHQVYIYNGKHGSEVWHSLPSSSLLASSVYIKQAMEVKYGIVTIVMLAPSVYINKQWK